MTMRPSRSAVEINVSDATARARQHISIGSSRDWRSMLVAADTDLRDTLKLWRLVWALGLMDIRLRYRGSILGPFWLTLSTAVMVGALGFLYSRLFHTDITTYLPFLSLSLVLWNFMSALVGDGCTCFTMAESMIRGMRMPLAMHAARAVVRNVLVLCHNIIVIAAVFIIMRKVPGAYSAEIIPALALWMIDCMAVCLLLGILCARFRDIPPIVASVMQIAFFVSPVLWSPTILAHRGLGIYLVKWNPFFALLEIVRGPLLGTPLALQTWVAALCYSLLLVLLALVAFMRARSRLAYWV